MDSSAFIFTGDEYIIQSYQKEGIPFFLSDTLIPGTIYYAGHRYDRLPLQWDVLQNYVLTKSLNGFSRIILRKELIDSFTIGNHIIIRLLENNRFNLQHTDFYDRLYNGNIQVLARRKKETSNSIREDKIVYHFKNIDKFYVRKEGVYFRVSNRRDVMNLLSGHSSGINKAVRQAGLNWRKDFEACLVVAAQQFDQSH